MRPCAHLFSGLASLVVGLAGCAVGVAPDSSASSGVPASGQVEAGPSAPNYDGPTADDAGADATPPDESDGGGTQPGDDAGTAPPADAGPPAPSCNAPNTCMAATSLGSLSGDTGFDMQTAQGTTSQWFTVRMTEDDTGAFAATMKLRAQLVSPPGSKFDLFVYLPQDDTSRDCVSPSGSGHAIPPQAATVSEAWGETGTFANNSPDDRTVSIEVRWIAGTCAPTAKWTLTLFGNQ